MRFDEGKVKVQTALRACSGPARCTIPPAGGIGCFGADAADAVRALRGVLHDDPSCLASRTAQRRSPGLGPGLRNLLSPRVDEEEASQVQKMDRVRLPEVPARRSGARRDAASAGLDPPAHLFVDIFVDVEYHGVAGRLDQRQRPANPKAACYRLTGGEGNAHVQAGETGGLAHGGIPDGWADSFYPRRTEGKSFFATGSMVLAWRSRPCPGFTAVAPQNRGLLYFCGFAGWFSFTNTMLGPATPAFPPTPGCAAC